MKSFTNTKEESKQNSQQFNFNKLTYFRPVFAQMQFNKDSFKSLEDIKQWYKNHLIQFGHLPDFFNKNHFHEDEIHYTYQMTTVDEIPNQFKEYVIEYDKGVNLIYVFSHTTVNGTFKKSLLQKMYPKVKFLD